MINNVTYKINEYDLTFEVKSLLGDLNNSYPNFSKWFDINYTKPNPERKIITVYDNDLMIGSVLIKENENESKICCFYILPKYRSLGIGSKLMQYAFTLFENKKILLTVSENNFEKIKPFLLREGFVVDKIEKNTYIDGNKEFFFVKNE